MNVHTTVLEQVRRNMDTSKGAPPENPLSTKKDIRDGRFDLTIYWIKKRALTVTVYSEILDCESFRQPSQLFNQLRSIMSIQFKYFAYVPVPIAMHYWLSSLSRALWCYVSHVNPRCPQFLMPFLYTDIQRTIYISSHAHNTNGLLYYTYIR